MGKYTISVWLPCLWNWNNPSIKFKQFHPHKTQFSRWFFLTIKRRSYPFSPSLLLEDGAAEFDLDFFPRIRGSEKPLKNWSSSWRFTRPGYDSHLLGFNGDLWGFNGDLWGFIGDIMRFTLWLWHVMTNIAMVFRWPIEIDDFPS